MAKQGVANKSFNIIALSPGRQRYYPAAMRRESWMGEHHVPHDRIDIPLGKSRYGGPVVELPPGVQYPEGLRFAAQLNLAEVAPSDVRGLLPAQGHLIVFADMDSETGLVIYANVPTETLSRTVVEHEDNFSEGVLIDGFEAAPR